MQQSASGLRIGGGTQVSSFNDRVIAEFRSQSGHVDGFGDRLVLVHSTGARTGEERVNPALSLRDGSSWLVIASAAGAERNPAWYRNLVAHPQISIETGAALVPVTATELDGDEYRSAFLRFTRTSAAFQQYQDSAGTRRLPIFRLSPR